MQARSGLALGLAALAGFVDVQGFLSLSGIFVSSMSGNSTQLGARLAHGDPGLALIPAAVIALFVTGVVAGSLVARRHAGVRATAMLALVATLLLGAALAAAFDHTPVAIALMTFAMGVENSALVSEGRSTVAVTYITGSLVRLGQAFAARLSGEAGTEVAFHVLLWVGIVLGAIGGAHAYARWQLDTLWIAVVVALLLVAVARRVDASRQEGTGAADPPA